MGSGKPATPEQLAAGVTDFERFGKFNVIWALCKAYNVTPAEAEQIELAYAVMTMQYESTLASYNEALSKPKK